MVETSFFCLASTGNVWGKVEPHLGTLRSYGYRSHCQIWMLGQGRLIAIQRSREIMTIRALGSLHMDYIPYRDEYRSPVRYEPPVLNER